MSRHGVVLDTTQNPQASETVREAQFAWIEGVYDSFPFPRSKWLSDLETDLRPFFPGASSRDLNLTARFLAPFPLAQHP